MARKGYQDGGEVTDDDPEIGGGGLSALDPQTALLNMMLSSGSISKEGLDYSKDLLESIRTSRADGSAGRSVVDMQKAQAAKVRQALQMARQRLQAQDYNRGDALLAASEAFSKPTRTGALGEIASNVFGAIREPMAKRKEFERGRDEALGQLDLAESQTDTGVNSTELELEKLREQMENNLATQALRNIGRPLTPGKQPMASVIPDSVKALDREYAKDYKDFIQGGSAKAAQGLGTLEFASQQLKGKNKSLTGPHVGTVSSLPVVGRGIQDYLWPAGSDVRDMIEQTVQESLRPILGSQFTQQEGERLIARIFNPRLEEWRNSRRLDWFIKQLKRAYASKVDLANYYQEHGTLFGFKGQTGYSIEDFAPPPEIGSEREEDIEGDELSPEARRSLQPGAMMGKDAEELREIQEAQKATRGHKKGGLIRGYQEGGVALPEEEAPPNEDDSEGMSKLQELWQELGWAPGAVAGGASGLGIGAILNGLVRRSIVGPERRVDEAIRREGLDPVEEAKEIKRDHRRGVPSMLLDVDAPDIAALTQHSLQFGAQDAGDALDALRERHEGARGRTDEQINKLLKPDQYFDEENRLLQNVSRDARTKLFQPIYDKYPGLPQDPVLNQIIATPEGQKALAWAWRFYQNQPGKKMGKENVTGKVQRPSLEFYDYIRKGFDRIIDREERSGGTEFSELLRDMRQTYTDRLDELAPKEYKDARAEYAGDLETRDAIRAGRGFMKIQPEQIAEQMKNMSFAQKDVYRTGVAQKLFETLGASSNDLNAAQKIVGSPDILARIEAISDNPKEFQIFQAALRKEAEMFRTGKDLIRRGEQARVDFAKERTTPLRYAAKTAPGFRFSISPLGWALRVMRDQPKMSAKAAAETLEVLRRGRPEEMDDFIKKAQRLKTLRGIKGPRRAVAAGLGAVAGALMDDDQPEQP